MQSCFTQTFEVNHAEFYISDVIEEIRDYYQDKMTLNQIDFQIGRYHNCLLKGDKNRLMEVLQNVIENAIKYGDGKKIWIDCERASKEYIIHIHNTGCTLDEKKLLHIFDSFFRGSNIGKKPGSGLGLQSVSYALSGDESVPLYVAMKLLRNEGKAFVVCFMRQSYLNMDL